MKRLLALCLTALFLCLFSACGPEQADNMQQPKQVTDYEKTNETPKKGGMLRLAMCGSKTLNPILAENKNNLYVLKLLYDGLFQRTASDAVEPVLCESYSVSPDGLVYEFIIKNQVSFHNGAGLTAADAEASLSLALTTDGYYKNRLSAVASYRSEGMKLFVTLHNPVINFPALLDFPVLSRNDLDGGYNAATYIPNGTGRYKVQSYKQSKELYLSVNENYHRDFSPYISNIMVYLLSDSATAVTMLENMQIDLLPSEVVNLYAYTPKRNLSSAEFSSGQFTFIGLNNQKPALLSPITRHVLAATLDTSAILEHCTIPYANVTDLPLSSKSHWNNGQPPAEILSVEQLNVLLTQAGWGDSDGNNVPDAEIYGEKTELKLEILVNQENVMRMKIAEHVKNAWTAAGIPSFITALPFAEFNDRIQNRQYDVFIGGVSITENYDLSFLLKTDKNFCGISSERIDQTLNALTLMDKETKKQALFHELCDIIRSETPLIGLYFENEVLVFDERLRGDINPSGSDVFYGIEAWFLSR